MFVVSRVAGALVVSNPTGILCWGLSLSVNTHRILKFFFFFLMLRRPPRSTPLHSSAASDGYKRDVETNQMQMEAHIGGPPSGFVGQLRDTGIYTPAVGWASYLAGKD